LEGLTDRFTACASRQFYWAAAAAFFLCTFLGSAAPMVLRASGFTEL
jgi:hypothetical protein